MVPTKKKSGNTLGKHITQRDPLNKGLACTTCKLRKVRCSGEQPGCRACKRTAKFEGREETSVICTYQEIQPKKTSANRQHKRKKSTTIDNHSSSTEEPIQQKRKLNVETQPQSNQLGATNFHQGANEFSSDHSSNRSNSLDSSSRSTTSTSASSWNSPNTQSAGVLPNLHLPDLAMKKILKRASLDANAKNIQADQDNQQEIAQSIQAQSQTNYPYFSLRLPRQHLPGNGVPNFCAHTASNISLPQNFQPSMQETFGLPLVYPTLHIGDQAPGEFASTGFTPGKEFANYFDLNGAANNLTNSLADWNLPLGNNFNSSWNVPTPNWDGSNWNQIQNDFTKLA